MWSTKAISATGQDKSGVNIVEYLIATEALAPVPSTASVDYYNSGNNTNQWWGGKGAAALGLIGREVNREDMLALAMGFAPDTGEKLCQNAGVLPTRIQKQNQDGTMREVLQGGHENGTDTVYTPFKCYSVLYSLTTDEAEKARLRKALTDAFQDSVNEAERKLETRLGKGGKDVEGIGGAVYSQHLHFSNRDLEPDIHLHNFWYGVAQRKDGTWGAYDNKELFRHARMLDNLTHSNLACNLRDLGYTIEQKEATFRNGEKVKQWGIKGISDELCDLHSQRTKAIREYEEKHNVSAQQACLATRKHKDEPSMPEMQDMWQKVSASLGSEHTDISNIKNMGPDTRLPATPIEDLLKKVHRSESVVCPHDLVKLIADENMGFMRRTEIEKAVEQFKQGLVVVGPKRLHDDDRGKTVAREYREERYQTPDMAESERSVVQSAKSREDEKHLQLTPEGVDKAIAAYEKKKNFTLSDEQKAVIRHQTIGTGGLCIVEGYAGSGKTSVSDVVQQAFTDEGYTLVGVAKSNAAAKKLQAESGIESLSVTKTLSMLDKGKMELSPKHVMVVDEAGMLDTRGAEQLMVHAKKQGFKIIMMGDDAQLQPIEAGSGFVLAKDAIGAKKLTEIRRQETQEGRDVARKFYNEHEQDGPQSRAEVVARGKSITSALSGVNAIHDFTTHNEARDAVVKDYLGNKATAENKLMLAHTRDDVAYLTKGTREGLRANGELQGPEFVVRCKDQKTFTERQFAEGDRVRFTSRDDTMGVVNGTEGVIKKIGRNWHDDGVEFHIDTEHGRLAFSSHEFNAIDHNYASTVHKSQGQGKDHVYHLYNKGMADNQSMLVAFTRSKKSYALYGQADELDGLYTRLGLERKKENALVQQPKAEEQKLSLAMRPKEQERDEAYVAR